MDHFKRVYNTQASLYDRMVEREDQQGNLFSAFNEITDWNDATVVEFGAGTGRLTRQMLFTAKQVFATDISDHMIAQAYESLAVTGMDNWMLNVADNRNMPFADNSADVVVEGWSFAHAVGWSPDNWREEIGQMLNEMQRILKPNGTAILLETMGTGSRKPEPPNEGLAELYKWWEEELGFAYRWIRTDYLFESVEEADELLRFFFGDELADGVVEKQLTRLPECTGIWYRTYP